MRTGYRPLFFGLLCTTIILLSRPASVNAGDVSVILDSTNGASAFIVYDQHTNLLLKVMSDGSVSITGTVSAAVFDGSGAQLTSIGGSSISEGAITSFHIATGAISSSDIGHGVITSNHLAAGSISGAALSHGYESGSISLSDFAKTNVTSFAGWEATTNINYAGSYGSVPVVTLSVETPSRAAAESLAPFVTERSTTQASVSIAIPDAMPQTIESGSLIGQSAQMAMVNGRPAIIYENDSGNLIRYSTATDGNGSSWSTPITANASTSPDSLSLAEVAGRPAIAWHNASNSVKNLMYVIASNAIGSAWGTPVTVDATVGVGEYASLGVVAGNPAIAYYNNGADDDLMYVRASNSIGSAWAPPVTVYATGLVGTYASLKVVNTLPAIAFYDRSNKDLLYTRATDLTGSTWPASPVGVYTNGDVGKHASLAVIDGNPAIAFYDYTEDDLLFVRATDSTGAAWDAPVQVYTNGNSGKYCSLAEIDGRPAITFYESTEERVLYIRANNASGSSWGTPETLQTNVFMYTGTTLLEANSAPAACFYSAWNNAVYYVRAGNPPADSTLNWIAVEP